MSELDERSELPALASVLDAVQSAIVLWHRDGRLAYANVRAQVLGEQKLAPGLTPSDVVAACRLRTSSGAPYPPERLFSPAVLTGQMVPFDGCECTPAGGRLRVFDGRTAPIVDASGGVRWAITTLRDVSEARRIEALGAGEARILELVAASRPITETLDVLARLFERDAEGMLASILLLRADGTLQTAATPSLPSGWARYVDGEPIGPNCGSCGTAAYSKAPVIVTDIESDARWQRYRDAALSFGLRACWSTPILASSGEVLGTFAFYYSEPRAPTPRLLALAERASRLATVAIEQQRRQAELDELAELKEREQLHTVLDVAPSAVAIVRAKRVRYANSLFSELFALRAGADFDERHAADEPEGAGLWQILCGGTPSETLDDVETQAEGRDGKLIDLLGTFRQVSYEGEPSTLAYLVDVTKLKRSETALRHAKDEAEAATRAKSLFLANMSHEIRTPMNAILGYAQLLQRDESLSATQKQSLEVIHSSGQHLLTLINDILEMSKIEAGRTTLSSEPFEVGSLLHEVERMFVGLAREKGLALSVELVGPLPAAFEGDAVKVRQVVINLVSNALKFTEHGEVRVRASASQREGRRCRVSISVEDTGPGIPASDLERIFQPFDQGDAGVRTSGTGLGLTISAHFARLMGGAIDIDSVVGEGSIFTFGFEVELARAHELAPAGSAALATGLAAGQAVPRVLVVDDVATNRELLVELLSRIGFEARVAASGNEALAIHDAWRPALVLMDLRMPGMNGLEATARLRAAGSEAVVIAITASGLSDAEPQALAAGANAFVRKPYREADLLAKIATLLGVSYTYPKRIPTPPPSAASAHPGLGLRGLRALLPAKLVEDLCDAARKARAQRLKLLAESVRAYSESGARDIALLADSFGYDELLAVLGPDVP